MAQTRSGGRVDVAGRGVSHGSSRDTLPVKGHPTSVFVMGSRGSECEGGGLSETPLRSRQSGAAGSQLAWWRRHVRGVSTGLAAVSQARPRQEKGPHVSGGSRQPGCGLAGRREGLVPSGGATLADTPGVPGRGTSHDHAAGETSQDKNQRLFLKGTEVAHPGL